MRKNTVILGATSLVGIIAGVSLMVPALADAQTTQTPNTTPSTKSWGGTGGTRAPGVFGTVTAINGDTLTVTQKARPAGMPGGAQPGDSNTTNTTDTTYTVDATNATVTKDNAASSLSGIAVNDIVMVQGTVSGTSVTATAIRDGMMMRGGMNGKGPGFGHGSTTPSIITGNGEPVIGGTITGMNGAILTVTNKSNVTYQVDATSATIEKAGKASTVSNIATGDTVIVQGTVNGSNVTATSVMDSGAASNSTSDTSGSSDHGGIGGFFGGIGGFFQKLFGFF